MTESLNLTTTPRENKAPVDVAAVTKLIVERLNQVLTGKTDVIRHALCTVFAGGHLLLEDVPGVGKTALASALTRNLGCEVTRVQFTADLLPADLTGSTIPLPTTGEFVFHPGPLFSNVVIADEINRASPRTQSALIECMAEGNISVDGTTHELPEPFLVIATQNPDDMAGTYPLPEAQRDRFMARLTIGYPNVDDEQRMVRGDSRPQSIGTVISRNEFLTIRQQIDDVILSEDAATYLVGVVRATRDDPRVRLGASPRAALQLAALARSWAAMAGRNAVLPDDIAAVAVSGLAHRLELNDPDAGANVAAGVIEDIISSQPVPQYPTRRVRERR